MRAKPTGQHYPARPLGQEFRRLGRTLSPPLGRGAQFPRTDPLRALGCGVEDLSNQGGYHPYHPSELRATLPAPPKVTNSYFAPLPFPFHSLLPFLKFPVALRVKLHSPAQLCLLIRGLESSLEPIPRSSLRILVPIRAPHHHSGFSQVLPPQGSLTNSPVLGCSAWSH